MGSEDGEEEEERRKTKMGWDEEGDATRPTEGRGRGRGEQNGTEGRREGDGEMASEMASDGVREGEGTTTVRRIASIRGTNETPCLAYLTLRS